MVNKWLIGIIAALFCGCVLFYNLWDNTRSELKAAKEYNKTLESELKRRDDNEKSLSKRITELTELYNANADWANSSVPDSIIKQLSKSCKACKQTADYLYQTHQNECRYG